MHSQNRINELMSRFVAQVHGATAMGRTDINHIAETILIPLFSEVFNLRHLKNLNETEQRNFPGIDLADEVERIAFQVTSTSNSTKVKNTLQKFVDHKLFKKFDRLVIYILTEKQGSYSGQGYEEIIDGTFQFNKATDIIDYRDVLSAIATFQQDKALLIERILEANFGERQPFPFGSQYQTTTESVFLNLLEVSFPKTLYVADVSFDRQGIISNSKSHRVKVHNKSSTRDVARAALDQLGLGFGVDWVCHEKKIVTFHDLEDDTSPLVRLVDKGTVTPLSSEEFYKIDENYDRVFKSLLWRCLQQKLYGRGVRWQHEEGMFIFSPPGDGKDVRKESWKDKKAGNREVFVRTHKNDDSQATWYCKHLGFRTQFKLFGNKWYLQINPEWFFSFDGYKKSFYHAEKVDWLKRQEDNSQVMYQLKFIAYYLTHQPPSNLFEKSHQYPFLSFGSLVEFANSPHLNDSDWKPNKAEGDIGMDGESHQMELFKA